MKKLLFSIVLLLALGTTNATHIVNSNVHYTYLGRNNLGQQQYQIKFVLYRDCDASQVIFDSWISIAYYDNNANKSHIKTDSIPLYYDSVAKPVVYPSGSLASTGCYRIGVYIDTFTAALNHPGFFVLHLRCCRRPSNNFLDDEGLATKTFIPADSNSSPRSNSNEAAFILGTNVYSNLDFSHQDADGDSLSYELYNPLAGGSVMNPLVTTYPTKLPADVPVKYRNGFSYQFPFKGLSPLNIDPQTGKALFINNLPGLYMVGVKVSEWRNGVLLSIHNREYALLYLANGNGITLKVTPGTGTNLICAWNKVTTDTVVKYKLLRNTDTVSNWDTIAILQPQDTSYNDTAIGKDTTYWYYVIGETTNPNTTLFSIVKSGIIKTPTSIATLGQGHINAYPNPATTHLYIDAEDNESLQKILIYTLQGQQIKTFTTSTNTAQIDISTLPTGIYYLQIQTKQGAYTQKFIKQ